MSLEIIPIEKIPGGDLYAHLDAHGLITLGMAVHPERLLNLSKVSEFYLWHEDGEPTAMHLETPTGELGVIDVLVLPQDKTMSKRLWNDIAALGDALRHTWFDERKYTRVQAFVPASRVNVERMLRAIGFMEETKKGQGLRGYFHFISGSQENCHIWSLLASDPRGRDRVEIAYEYAET